MAKRKTAKAEKIVDLKPKAEKITDEQLKKVQSIVNTLNRAQLELGMMETKKHTLLHNIQTVQDQLTVLQSEFEKEYGTVNINIQTGEIDYTDGKADKKD
tara:strand:- start:1956 stop:2255 length:300 start_codon:yes stop_codon:yes gene_type:complete